MAVMVHNSGGITTKAIELYTVKWLKMVNFMLFKIYCRNISWKLIYLPLETGKVLLRLSTEF